MRPRVPRILSAVFLLFAVASSTGAQGQPFLLVRTPFAGTVERSALSYIVGYSERSFAAIDGDGLRQAAFARWHVGSRFAVHAGARMELTGSSHALTSEAEVEWNALGGPAVRTPLALGFGVRREAGPTAVVTGRVSASGAFTRSLFGASVLLERPLDSERDPIDVITSAGYSYQFSDNVRAGVEVVGQDLEGFWDPNEAEGGAALFAGPSLLLSPTTGRWSFAVGAGPALHVTRSSRMSGAPRDVPNAQRSGYVVRTSFRFHPGR